VCCGHSDKRHLTSGHSHQHRVESIDAVAAAFCDGKRPLGISRLLREQSPQVKRLGVKSRLLEESNGQRAQVPHERNENQHTWPLCDGMQGQCVQKKQKYLQ
jgi:hypothetical protein